MAVMIGMASKDERGQYKGGAAGDQTGQEVYIRTWYSRPWNVVIRWKDTALAQKFAQVLTTICNNSKVGYDQNERTTLWAQCERISWDIGKISQISACECDCSSLMAVCARFCGLSVSKDIWTGNLEAAFRATGKVESLRQSMYTACATNLHVGDILLNTQHHVAAVVSVDSAAKMEGTKVAQYAAQVTASDYLNIRQGPGSGYQIRKVGNKEAFLLPGCIVSIEAEQSGWGKLTGVDNAWVSLQYLKK